MPTILLTTWKVVDSRNGNILRDGFYTKTRAHQECLRFQKKGIPAIYVKVPA